MTEGSAPIDATPGEDLSGLLRQELSDRRSRDLAETELIDRAYSKYIFRARRKKSSSKWLTDEFIRRSHLEMFGDLWDWAGKYRTVELNIGVDWHRIPEQIVLLCDDFKFWDSDDSQMTAFEIAARLQNRLTRIHPFKNGNGRHARLLTDIFLYSRRMRLPRWPQIQRLPQGDVIRDRYLAAMKKADHEDYVELIHFIEDCSKES